MSRLIYFMPMSLDGFIASDYDPNKDWSAPEEQVFAFINELHRPIGTYLYGRRNYETMAVWQTPDVIPGLSSAMRDFAPIWQAAEKVVYSTSLESVSTPNTRLEKEFNPKAVHDLKTNLPHDITIAGPNLAEQAVRAGLVDEIWLLITPVILGGGTPVLPRSIGVRLELLDERRIGDGWVYMRYRTVI